MRTLIAALALVLATGAVDARPQATVQGNTVKIDIGTYATDRNMRPNPGQYSKYQALADLVAKYPDASDYVVEYREKSPGYHFGKHRLTYNRGSQVAVDLVVENGVKETFRGVTPAAIAALAKSNPAWWNFSRFADVKYDYDSSAVQERARKGDGDPPHQSALTGRVPSVEKWLKANLHDPRSLEWVEASRPSWHQDSWAVRVKFRANNALGAKSLYDYWFYIRGDQVVQVKR